MMKKSLALAIDLGGTSIRGALIQPDGTVLEHSYTDTPKSDNPHVIIGEVNRLAQGLLEKEDIGLIAGIGASVPGPVDPRKGVIYRPPNLPGWTEVPLKRIWEQEFGLPVWVGNDANFAALGEQRFGVGRGVDDLIYITVSTGLGGGIIVGGHLLEGATGMAGEVGHMTIMPDGPLCNCGNRGCLEALASGLAIARMAQERLSRDRSSASSCMINSLEEVTAETVAKAASKGDSLALEIMKEAAGNLGIGVANLVQIFNPQLVIIGGGVSKAGKMLLGPVQEAVRERTMPSLREGLTIVTSALGDDASLMGAAASVWKRHRGAD